MRGLSMRVRFKGLAPDATLPWRMLWDEEAAEIDGWEDELAKEVERTAPDAMLIAKAEPENKNDHNHKIVLEPERYEDDPDREKERSAALMMSFAPMNEQNIPDSQRQRK